jgi:uncharacterized protein (TIGR02285 family)
VQAEKVIVGADVWKDVSTKDGKGIYLNLLNRIYGKDNTSINIDSYNRNLAAFKQNKIDILVGVFREDVHNAILPHWFLDTDDPVLAFYHKKTNIQSPADFANKLTSWVRGYHFENFLFYNTNNYPVNSPQEGFALLNSKRIDIFIDYKSNLPKQFNNKFATYEVLPRRHLYLAFQFNKQGQALANKFDSEMKKLRTSGELASIFALHYKDSMHDKFSPERKKMIIYTDEVELLRSYHSKNDKEVSTLNNTLSLLFDQLDEYDFEFKILNDFSKMLKTNKQDNLCYSDMLKTPVRLKSFDFSSPSSLFLGLRAYSKKRLPYSGEINIESVLTNNDDYTLGIVNGRSYGESLDLQLHNIPSKRLVKLPTELNRMLTIFDHGRFDLMIEYPQDIFMHWGRISKNKLYSYELTQAKSYYLGHMMCYKSEKNRIFLDKFNRALKRLVASGTLLAIQSKNVPASDKVNFEKYFHQVFNSSR